VHDDVVDVGGNQQSEFADLRVYGLTNRNCNLAPTPKYVNA
jgi:hypothetical protein